jgi:hypothetical protein
VVEEPGEDQNMAASMTTDVTIPISAPVAATVRVCPNRRRRITPEAGHALEILGHAIEYFTDEFVHSSVEPTANDAQLKAVQLLMALNRQVYFECPEVPTFGERWRALLHLLAA